MSIQASGSNYMSNAEILTWMEGKTDGIYGQMRDAMDTSNTRAGAEDAMNQIKAKLADLKTKDSTPDEVRDLINQAIHDYKDIPEVGKALEPYAKDLNAQYEANTVGAQKALAELRTLPHVTASSGRGATALQKHIADLQAAANPKPVEISADKIDAWTKDLADVVSGLGKQDQLGLINIQEFNAQLNQAKQTASALMDAADKAANAIISHIS